MKNNKDLLKYYNSLKLESLLLIMFIVSVLIVYKSIKYLIYYTGVFFKLIINTPKNKRDKLKTNAKTQKGK